MQKYFFTFLLTLSITFTNAQNNAMNLVGSDIFYVAGSIGIGGHLLGFNINNFTVEYDFYLNSASNYNGRFFSSSNPFDSIPQPIEFYINNAGASTLKLGNGAAFETIPGTPTFNVGQWYHVAFVVNNTATKNIKMYVNGIAVVDFNFSQAISINTYPTISLGSRPFFSGDCKIDNLRIWSVLRSASEIFNSYNNCLNNTETGLLLNMDFDRSNIGTIRNRVVSSGHKNGGFSGNSNVIFSNGTGCTTPYIASPLTVTGDFAGTYYAAKYLNGKPYYITDEVVCDFFNAEGDCIKNNGNIFEIFWDGSQWVLNPAGCVWLFTSCANEYFDNTSILATNPSNTAFAPCTGWTYTNTSNSSTFSSTECTLLSSNSFAISNFEVYPNPFIDTVTINAKENATIIVYNVLGKIIKSQNLHIGKNTISLGEESEGIYFAKIQNAKGSQIIKWIKN